MCTGNFYCSEITPAAVTAIAQYLGILPELIEEAAHVYQAYETPEVIIREEQLYPKHPQNIYRFFLENDLLVIHDSHACVSAERI